MSQRFSFTLGTFALLGMFIVSVGLTGCATLFSAKPQKADALELKVASLEGQVEALGEKLTQLAQQQEALEGELKTRAAKEKAASGVAKAGASSRKLSARQIQLALKTAGFYPGPIDGKLGPKTQEALKAFQRSQNLTPDGIVGAKTASRLAEFLPEE